MAVATQPVTTLCAARGIVLPRAQPALAPRCLAPVFLATIDTLALAVAVLLLGSNSSLVLLSVPFGLAVIAVAVTRSSPGPVLFRQKRIGQHGEEINVAKFRSLAVNQ
jgi:Bacterial sugar transferase